MLSPTRSRARRRAGRPGAAGPLVVVVLGLLVVALGACSNEGDARTAETVDPPTTAGAGTPSTVLDLTTTTLPGPTRLDVQTTALGPVLVDAEGRTLYAYAGDTAAAPGCVGVCLQAWPPLLASSVAAAPGVGGGPFTLTARADAPTGPTGGQVTASGRLLYRFAGDARPGETFGQGFNGVWFVVRPDGSLLHPTTTTTTTTDPTTAPD